MSNLKAAIKRLICRHSSTAMLRESSWTNDVRTTITIAHTCSDCGKDLLR